MRDAGAIDRVPRREVVAAIEHDIGNRNRIQQCLAFPSCVNARILLLQTLISMKRVRPEILPEFKDRLTLLLQEHPLIQPAQAVLQRLFNEVLSA